MHGGENFTLKKLKVSTSSTSVDVTFNVVVGLKCGDLKTVIGIAIQVGPIFIIRVSYKFIKVQETRHHQPSLSPRKRIENRGKRNEIK